MASFLSDEDYTSLLPHNKNAMKVAELADAHIFDLESQIIDLKMRLRVADGSVDDLRKRVEELFRELWEKIARQQAEIALLRVIHPPNAHDDDDKSWDKAADELVSAEKRLVELRNANADKQPLDHLVDAASRKFEERERLSRESKEDAVIGTKEAELERLSREFTKESEQYATKKKQAEGVWLYVRDAKAFQKLVYECPGVPLTVFVYPRMSLRQAMTVDKVCRNSGLKIINEETLASKVKRGQAKLNALSALKNKLINDRGLSIVAGEKPDGSLQSIRDIESSLDQEDA